VPSSSASSFSFKASTAFNSTSSFSLKDFLAFSSTSLFYVLAFLARPSAFLFSFSVSSTCYSTTHFSVEKWYISSTIPTYRWFLSPTLGCNIYLMLFYDMSLSAQTFLFHPFHTYSGFIMWESVITTAYISSFSSSLLEWHNGPYLHGFLFHSLRTHFFCGPFYYVGCWPFW
jgi:hypothetical protein